VRIGIVSQSYYPRFGGVTEHVHYSAAALRRRGHEVTIITGGGRAAREGPGPPGVERLGHSVLIPFNRAFVDLTVGFGLRRRMRRLLGTHVLVVRQAAFEDACGRLVASLVTPLLVTLSQPSSQPASRDCIDECLLAIREHLRTESASTDWQRESILAHRGFWTARVAREKAIALSLERPSPSAFQPGLFDHRAQDQREAARDDRRALLETARLRIEAAERGLAVALRSPRTALVLLP